jgi:hypothetical protein
VSADANAASAPGGSAGGAQASSPSFTAPAAPELQDRPEVLVGAAFAGGLVTALLLRRLRGKR